MWRWLHDRISGIEKQRDQLFAENKPFYYFLAAILAIATAVIVDVLAAKIESLQWRTVMRGLILLVCLLPIGFFLLLEFRAARRKSLQISWTGWIVAFCLAVNIGWLHFKIDPGVTGTTASLKPIAENTADNPPQTQWYLHIDSVSVTARTPNGDYKNGTRFRLIATVNGQDYSFPSRAIWTMDGFTNGENFLLPPVQGTGIRYQYHVRFSGFLRRDPQHTLNQTNEQILPMEESGGHLIWAKGLPRYFMQTSITVADPNSEVSGQTTITIMYSIERDGSIEP